MKEREVFRGSEPVTEAYSGGQLTSNPLRMRLDRGGVGPSSSLLDRLASHWGGHELPEKNSKGVRPRVPLGGRLSKPC